MAGSRKQAGLVEPYRLLPEKRIRMPCHCGPCAAVAPVPCMAAVLHHPGTHTRAPATCFFMCRTPLNW